jgi:hypothetical protein
LQATVPRVLAALLPGNLTVASTNVTGFPDFYSSVRSVEISTTNQVFVSTTIAGVTPSSIVLTAKLNNILGTVTWSIVSGSATFTTNTNTLSIANSGMTSNVVVFQASVTSNGITYTDRTTVVKVVQGSSTVTAFLTNETFSVAALAAGSVLSYAYSGGTYKVFSGSTEVTGTAVAYSIVSSTGVSATVATTGIYSIDNMTSDSASFVIRAIYAGITVDKTYSVTKSKSTFNGDTGSNGSDGSNGSNGARGTVNIARSITGSIWSDTEARLALSTNGYGLPQIRDIVTLYNTSTNYSESKFYDGTNFLSLDAYINGNLLVTGTIVSDKIAANAITSIKIAANAITADKITAGTITADKIDSRGLSIKDVNGNIILAAGTALQNQINPYASGATVGAPNGTYVGSSLAQDIETLTGAQAKANAAQSASISAAATASQARVNEAEVRSAAYADGIVTAEEQRAINDATTKANNAEAAAKSAASADATAKADVASTKANWSGVVNNDGNLPANRATVGATFGTNVFGQITAATASTFIANASINTAQIADLAVQTAQIDTAAITTAKIGNLQVDTLQIAGNAVTLASSAKVTNPSSGSYASAITTSSGGPIFISCFAQKAATNYVINLNLYRGGPPTSGGTLIASASAGVSSATSVALNFVDQPGTGTQSYYLRVISSDPISFVTLFTLETKK